jgi:hypothetical protein
MSTSFARLLNRSFQTNDLKLLVFYLNYLGATVSSTDFGSGQPDTAVYIGFL